jgi:hypothetical protein
VKLSEILKVDPIEDSLLLLPDEVIALANDVSTLNSKRVFRIFYDGVECFFTLENNNIESYICLQPVNFHHLNGHIIKRIFVPNNLRNKGIASNLLVIAKKLLMTPIFSDELHTPLAKALWDSISKKLPVKVINTQTGEIFGREKISNEVIYTQSVKNSADYLLMLETHSTTIVESAGKFPHTILEPIHLFSEGST